MKKTISLVLALVLALSLTACGKTSVSLDKSEHTFTAAGETVQLTAEAKKADTLTWSSSDETVATVDGNGLVTAVAPGTATITVSAGEEVTATCAITCGWTTPVDLEAFYWDLYDAMYPLDADGYPTGPSVENFAAVPEMLEAYYPGLADIETKQCLVYMPMMSGVPYELVLIEVADPSDVEAVKAILQTRIDTETANQMNYPMVIENWELNSRIVVNGSYIMMAVCENCDDYVEAFNAQF